MPDLEILAHADLPTASRDLAAMQALAQRIVAADASDARLRPLARALSRDLDAALAGKAPAWSEARTRFEARKLDRLQSGGYAAEGANDSAPAYDAEPEWDDATSNRTIITRLAIALVAAALWALWIVQLNYSGPVAWDGGTGPAQTQNLFTLYAPAVLALLATLIAITPPDRITNAPDR